MNAWEASQAEHAAIVQQIKCLVDKSSELLAPLASLDEVSPVDAIRKCRWNVATYKATIGRLEKLMRMEMDAFDSTNSKESPRLTYPAYEERRRQVIKDHEEALAAHEPLTTLIIRLEQSWSELEHFKAMHNMLWTSHAGNGGLPAADSLKNGTPAPAPPAEVQNGGSH